MKLPNLGWFLPMVAALLTTQPAGQAMAQQAAAAKTIKIVSSLPRTGSAKQQTDTIVNGIKMALAEAGNKAAGFKIEYLDLDDATATAGQWTAEQESANARRAANEIGRAHV